MQFQDSETGPGLPGKGGGVQGGGQGWPDRHLYADGQVTMYMNNNYLSGGNSLLLSKKVSICGSEEQEMVDTDEKGVCN